MNEIDTSPLLVEQNSGAGVMCGGQGGAQWLGVLIGGDGERSGVVPAHRILDQLAPTFGPLMPSI